MEIVLIVFLVLMVIGMPIGFAIGISGATFFLQNPELPITTIVQLPISQSQNINLLAVPLFVFAGSLMNASGITDQLIRLAMLLTGHMRGGMAQVCIAVSTLMGGVSGSSNADAAMEARILGPEMTRQGYPKGYTAAVIGYSSLITSTIPPGVGLILYGTVGEVSIGRLFAAGLTAGLMMAAILMIAVHITASRRKFAPARETRAQIKEIVASLRDTIWALIFPILLIGGIRFGLFTPSEVGAFACVYALFIGFLIYRKLNWRTLKATLREAVGDVSAIMYMITMSGIFGYGIPLEKIPQKLTVFILGVTDIPALIMIVIIFFLIVFGMFMDGAVIILLLTPILLPLVKTIGYDPVFFGVIVSVIVTLGILTPPVGIAMYTICGIMECKLQDYLKESPPFFLAIMLLTGLYLLFPQVILFVPKLIYGS
jgi:tripartite ATP-independent transporter DctM subunit